MIEYQLRICDNQRDLREKKAIISRRLVQIKELLFPGFAINWLFPFLSRLILAHAGP
jgi:hypothetical protein